jgi:hypothetical protein
MAALRLARANCDVTVYERLPEILSGASFNNQNRLHLGFHYPRDVETARQCVRGFTRFKESFHEAILGDFPNAYFIASQGSHVSPDDYLAFCEGLQLPYEVVDIGGFEPRVLRVDLGLLVDEVVYDCQTLRTVLSRRLSESSAKVQVSVEVESVRRTSSGFMLDIDGLSVGPYDAIVNCTYSDINRFANELGHEVPLREFEYTMVPVLEWNEDPVGITIMDGPFMTILPFGHTNRFLLYHVEHTVLAREVGHHLDRAWLDPGDSPGAQLDRDKFLESILGACREYVPSLASAKPVGFLQGPRVVLANRGMTDARPSIVEAPEPGYVSVFAGKIDHCVWVADEVAEKLGVD